MPAHSPSPWATKRPMPRKLLEIKLVSPGTTLQNVDQLLGEVDDKRRRGVSCAELERAYPAAEEA